MPSCVPCASTFQKLLISSSTCALQVSIHRSPTLRAEVPVELAATGAYLHIGSAYFANTVDMKNKLFFKKIWPGAARMG